ncbi:MAG: hypothetical protein HY238_05090 [Acidobacteria bacterium]|nr:hypothetical protein [Acidobacteriota bacterium]
MLVALASVLIPPLPALAQQNALPEQNSVTVVMYFEAEHAPITLSHLQREVEFIMEPLDLQFRWRLGKCVANGEVFHHLVVVHFKGRCEMVEYPSWEAASGSLGAAEMSEGKLIPFCRIECNRVREFIRPLVKGESFIQMHVLLGRALGRVLAHELYHVLADTTRHGSSGVTKSFLTPEELVDRALKFQSQDLKTFDRLQVRSFSASGAGDGR